MQGRLWDPRVVDMNDMNKAIDIMSWKTVIRAALTLIKEVVKERKSKGKDPFCVPIIKRQTKDGKPEVRFVNFAYGDPIDGERVCDEKGYPGALGQAESLFYGVWRLATDEEEEAEYVRQKRSQLDAAVQKIQTHAAVSQATAASSEAYKQAVGVVNAANLAATKTVEKPIEVNNEITEIKAQLATLMEENAALKAMKPKRGRPAKTQEPAEETVTA